MPEDKIKGVDAKQAEEFGLFLARNKEKIIQACKGKPELLGKLDSDDDTKVTPIKASK